MLQSNNTNHLKKNASQPLTLMGWWNFNERADNIVPDLSGKGHNMKPNGSATWLSGAKLEGAIALDGATQWLGTDKPVLCTDTSFSVVAWVRLDSIAMNGKLALKKGEHALTAVSQDSPTHSPFYLGVRQIDKTLPDGTTSVALKWNFTVAPMDGSETGPFVWEHAYSTNPLDDSMLNKWVMLIGVCDVEKRITHLFVPSINETGTASVPDAWTFWKANGGLQVGRGRWLGQNVDPWPGHIGSVRVFSGILTADDAKRLYLEDSQ